MKYLSILAILSLLGGCQSKQDRGDSAGNIVAFPEVTGPIRITQGPEEHFFASYYGINSFSKSQKYATVLQTEVRFTLPTEKDTAVLGLVDLESNEFVPVAKTTAWNFQEGCMAHWLGTSPDSLIIYNDYRDGKFISVILNVHTKEELKVLDRPVSAVAPNGKEAVGMNFARLRMTRTDYGYGGAGQDARTGSQFPDDDGIFHIDLETGESKLLVAIKDIESMVPELKGDAIEYFAHVVYSRDGSKLSWLARGHPVRNTTVFIVNRDGTELMRAFPDGWEGSHYDWLNGNELMVTAAYDAKQYAHVLFTAGDKDYKRLGNGLLDYDGHGTFSPDGKWMITDSYPTGGAKEQRLYLMDMKTEAVLPLGRYYHPDEYKGENGWSRCDLHPRWSPDGTILGVNSVFEGSRQVYIFKFGF
jgi:hypothetical protein